jgi:hypothetical protein
MVSLFPSIAEGFLSILTGEDEVPVFDIHHPKLR